jgi:polyhydroxyalkanoate synthase subunit PhaC
MTDTKSQTPAQETGQEKLADPAQLMMNFARLFEHSAALARVLADQTPQQGSDPDSQIVPVAQVSQALNAIAQAHMKDPATVMAAQSRLWEQYTQIWNNAWMKALGHQMAPVIAPARNDKRFKDADWTDNTVYDAVKQYYLVTAKWLMEIVKDAPEVDGHTRHKARFYVENIINMFSPSNFAALNPEVMKATIASNGDNLVRGLDKLRADLTSPDGKLHIQQVDKSNFKLGENIAVTPGKVVFRNEILELIQYVPIQARAYAIPLLIVPPWINKYYILDLNVKKSFVKFCVENGLTVFIISWRNARETDQPKTFSNYITEGLMEAVEAVQKATGSEKVNTVGFCIGGTMLATAMGYLAAKGESPINSSTFFTTQVDFELAGDLKVYVDEEQVKWIEGRMEPKGYLPGNRMADAFNLLRSNDLIWNYVVNNYLLGKDPPPFDLLYWNSDSTRMPSAVHSFYLREFYIKNALARGALMIEGHAIDLKQVKAPVYNLACREDHIAPAQSVFRLGQHFGGDTRLVIAGSGHIAGVINPPEANKYSYFTNDQSADTYETWMRSAVEMPGSWWTNWLDWISQRSGEKGVASVPGDRDLKIICDAPGEFVHTSGAD